MPVATQPNTKLEGIVQAALKSKLTVPGTLPYLRGYIGYAGSIQSLAPTETALKCLNRLFDQEDDPRDLLNQLDELIEAVGKPLVAEAWHGVVFELNQDWVEMAQSRIEDEDDDEPTDNVFCPTGPGGGVDATCSPGGEGKLSPAEMGEPSLIKGAAWLPFVDPDDVNQWQLNARSVKAVESAEKELKDNILNNRVEEYSSWDDVSDDDQIRAEDAYVDSNYETVLEDLIHDEQERDIADKREQLEEDNHLARRVWEDFVEENNIDLPEFVDPETGEVTSHITATNYKGQIELQFASDTEDFASKILEQHGSDLNDKLRAKIEKELERYTDQWESMSSDNRDDAMESVRADWQAMSDEQKFKESGIQNYVKITEPETYEPFEGDSDYEKTQVIARELQANLTVKELEERGLKMDKSFDPKHLAQQMWGGNGWVGSSTTPNGLLIQHAAALELGGHKQEWDTTKDHSIRTAANNLAKAYLNAKEYQGTTSLDRTNLGIEIAKAHVAATWATTQFILDKAGEKTVNVYRGLQIELPTDVKTDLVSTTADPFKGPNYLKLPDLQLKRNGAASTAHGDEGLRVANRWQGIGDVPKNASRVVLRIAAPKESVLSLPCFGKNEEGEHEVVITGNKYKWDAFLDKAPSLEVHPHGKH